METDVDGNPRRYALAAFFEPLAEHLAALAEPPAQAPAAKPVTYTFAGNGMDAMARAAREVATWDKAGAGDRNQTAIRRAFTLRNDYLLPDDYAWQLFVGWNSKNVPPLDEGELLEIFQGAAKYAKRPPGSKATSAPSGYSFTIGGQPVGGEQSNGSQQSAELDATKPIPLSELIKLYPHLNDPIIDRLLRRGETMNIVAPSKAGKSWLSNHCGLCFASGQLFLGEFKCTPGRVLLLDNELHRNTIGFRNKKVAEAMGLDLERCLPLIEVKSLRGERMDLVRIAQWLEQFKPGDYSVIILDAWYRALPAGVSENENEQVMQLYNIIDYVTNRLDCGWINVHHSTKGLQGDKRVTDVGSGASAQARAADTHLVLREHEDKEAAVLGVALRSFPPVEPIALRFEFPLWVPDDSLDPEKLKGKQTANDQRQKKRDAEGMGKLSSALVEGAATFTELGRKTGFGHGRLTRLLNLLESEGAVEVETTNIYGNRARQYRIVSDENK
jgi:hypothetical protein